MRKIILMLTILLVFTGGLCAEGNSAEKFIHHAETYFWLGMNEHGDMKDYARGLEFLDSADDLISDSSDPEQVKLKNEIEALRRDLIEQTDMTHDTLAGVFPGSRFIGPPLFIDAGANGSYEIVDDAYIIAHAAAIEGGLSMADPVGAVKSQAGALVFSSSGDVALENEAAYLLNRIPSFYLHTKQELMNSFTEAEISMMQNGMLEPEAWQRVITTLGDTHLIVLNFEETDQVDDVYFYTAFFQMYEGSSGSLVKHFSVMGFARDRTPALRYILWTDLALFFAAGLFYTLISRRRFGPVNKSGLLFAAGLVFCALGRFLPYIFTSLLSPLYPEPETLAILSFWWPAAAGLLVMAGPAFLYFALSGRIGRMIPAAGLAGRGGIVFLSLGLGAAGFLSQSVYIYEGSAGFTRTVPLITAVAGAMYILGRVIDTRDEAAKGLAAVSLSVILVIASVFSLGSSVVFFSALGAVLAALGIAGIGLVRSECGREDAEEDAGDYSGISGELAVKLLKPGRALFTAPPIFDDISGVLTSPDIETRAVLLCGPEGRGKSIMSRALAEKMIEQKTVGAAPLLLRGSCPGKGEAGAFGLFERVFSTHNALSALISTDDRLDRTAKSLEELAGSLFPIPLEILFPEGLEGPPKTAGDIHQAIYAVIRKIAGKQGLIMVLEDLHLIDDDSRELLLYLLSGIKAEDSIIIICNSENETIAAESGLPSEQVFQLPPAGPDEMSVFLTAKLEIHQSAVDPLLTAFNLQSGGSGEMGDLVRMISFFAREDLFYINNNLIELKLEYRRAEMLPVLPDVYDEIKSKLDSLPEYERVLGCAACLGQEFLADTVAESLQIPRLEMLDTLRRIESDTGFIYDVRENDDCYAFSSYHVYEAVKTEMEIRESGPLTSDIPQIVREYHRRLAETLVRQLENTGASDLIPEIAGHYYAAGISHAEKAWDYILKTVELSMNAYIYRQAFTFIEYGFDCARVLPGKLEKDRVLLMLFLRNAHLSGLKRGEAAEVGWSYHQDFPAADNSIKLATARACYEYAVSGKRDFFSRAFSAAESVLQAEAVGAGRAEALQFMGLAAEPGDSKRREYLQESLHLLEQEEDSVENMIVKARVLDSLGRDIMYDDPEQAETFFRTSLSIKADERIADKPGQAISLGALGNLYHFVRKDFAAAVDFYSSDLEISVEINDLTGQTKMNSLIAGCREGLGEYEQARESYQQALELCQNDGSPVDRFFAAAGIMFTAIRAGCGNRELLKAGEDFAALLAEQDLSSMLAPDNTRNGFLRDRLGEVLSEMVKLDVLKTQAEQIKLKFSY